MWRGRGWVWTLKVGLWAGPLAQRAKLCGPRHSDTRAVLAQSPRPPWHWGPGSSTPLSGPTRDGTVYTHPVTAHPGRQGVPALAVPGRSRVPWGLMPLHHWGPCSPSLGWGPLQRSAGAGEMARPKSGHFLKQFFLFSPNSQPHRTRNPSHLTTQARKDWAGGLTLSRVLVPPRLSSPIC